MGRISRGSLVGLFLCMVWCAVVGNWLMINGKLMMIMLDSEDGINKQKRAGCSSFIHVTTPFVGLTKTFLLVFRVYFYHVYTHCS